jgi:hypothetical protein
MSRKGEGVEAKIQGLKYRLGYIDMWGYYP